MPSPEECIINEIKRRLKNMDGRTVSIVCDLIADKYRKGRFKRATDLINEGVKFAKKLDKGEKIK